MLNMRYNTISIILLAGCPAAVKKKSEPWYIRDDREYEKRVSEVEALRQAVG